MGKIEKMNSLTDWERELALLENKSNLRKLLKSKLHKKQSCEK